MANPAQFLRQVRQEVSKVTWPTRRDTAIATVIVMAVSVIAALAFFGIDFALAGAVKFILGA